MTVLEWDQVGDRLFEAGVSKGVLYKSDSPGVPWNGLVSVDEGVRNSAESVYFDGVKFNDLVTIGDFNGTIKALFYPDEFLECEGIIEDEPGFMITGQIPERFGLCYRTEIGNDISGLNAHYKLHLLYNLTAIPQQRTHQTLSLSADPIEFEWAVTSIPDEVDFYRPTAHIILDSRNFDPFMLTDIENTLYGTEDTEPTLPSVKALSNFIKYWGGFTVIDNGDGTWTAYSSIPGAITMLDESTFEITSDTAVVIDPDNYTLSSAENPEV